MRSLLLELGTCPSKLDRMFVCVDEEHKCYMVREFHLSHFHPFGKFGQESQEEKKNDVRIATPP